jgi:hypothetical protein
LLLLLLLLSGMGSTQPHEDSWVAIGLRSSGSD